MIMFIFGAGAEASFNLPVGKSFAKDILFPKKELRTVSDFYMEKYNDLRNDLNLWYTKPLEMDKQENIEALKSLVKESVKMEMYEKYYKGEEIYDTKEQFKQVVEKRQAEITKCKNTFQKNFVTKHPNYRKLLDKRFHTLINPITAGPQNFWKVIYYYTLGYISIYKHFLDLNNEEIKDLLDNPDVYYKKFIEKIKEFNIPNYYKTLKNILKHENNIGDKINIVTTNYTPIAEEIIEAKEQNICYLHGRLNWFESAYRLEVYDICDKKTKEITKGDVLFPFILLQSGVKPIICKKQLNELSKLSKYFNDAGDIVIIGYGIGGDDNHLNSLIANHVRNKKKIHYFNYGNECKEITQKALKGKLRLETDEIINFVKIYNINNENSLYRFEEVVRELLKK